MKNCKSCALWNREMAMDKAGRIRKDRVARCLWQFTGPWPVSLRNAPFISPGYTSPDDGALCPCWKSTRHSADVGP